MPLSNVNAGDPHAPAHNAERTLINSLEASFKTPAQLATSSELTAAFANKLAGAGPNEVNILSYYTSGTHDAAMDAALSAVTTNGGIVRIPSNISLSATHAIPVGVTIRGPGMVTAGSKLGAIIACNIVGSASLFTAAAGGGVTIENLAIVAYSASFTGTLVDFTAAALTTLENVFLQATATADLLHLDQTTYHQSKKVNFVNGKVQVLGKATQASYTNGVEFLGCRFGGGAVCHIKNAGQAWLVSGGAIEYIDGGAAGIYRHDAGVRAESLTFKNIWAGDITSNPGGSQIVWSGDNLTVEGSFLGWNDGTFIQVDENGCNGIVLKNNQYNAFHTNAPTTLLDFGSTTGHSGLELTSSKIYTPLSHVILGALPSRSHIDNTLGGGHHITSNGSPYGVNTLPDNDQVMAASAGTWAAFDISKNSIAWSAGEGPGGDGAVTSTTNVTGPQDIRVQTVGGTSGVAAVPLSTIFVGIWVKALDIGTRRGDLIVQTYNAAGANSFTFISSNSPYNTQANAYPVALTKNAWVLIGFSFVVPAGVVAIQLQPRIYSTVSGERYRFSRGIIRAGDQVDWSHTGDAVRIGARSIMQVGSTTNAPVTINAKGNREIGLNTEPGSGTGGVGIGDGLGNTIAKILSLGNQSGGFQGAVIVQPRNAMSLASNGAVAIDASLGDAIISLSANATATTIINGIIDQIIRISYVQDATGGRTYVWPTNAKFAGGTAPNDTTASRRSTVTLRYDGTNWYEITRAVAVG